MCFPVYVFAFFTLVPYVCVELCVYIRISSRLHVPVAVMDDFLMMYACMLMYVCAGAHDTAPKVYFQHDTVWNVIFICVEKGIWVPYINIFQLLSDETW